MAKDRKTSLKRIKASGDNNQIVVNNYTGPPADLFGAVQSLNRELQQKDELLAEANEIIKTQRELIKYLNNSLEQAHQLAMRTAS